MPTIEILGNPIQSLQSNTQTDEQVHTTPPPPKGGLLSHAVNVRQLSFHSPSADEIHKGVLRLHFEGEQSYLANKNTHMPSHRRWRDEQNRGGQWKRER